MADRDSAPGRASAPEPERPPHLADDSPTELVEDERGEVFERLSGGTATLLLAWLIGIGAGSALLAAWIFVFLLSGERPGLDALFSGFGLYVAIGGASGPCILWLAGRAQGHSLSWFLLTAAKIALVMVALVLAVIGAALLVIAGALPGTGALLAAAFMVALALALSVLWALAVWSADRYIARARVEGE